MNGYNDHKLVCTFYTKIGACRHGEKCSRRHIKPTKSNTILLCNLYQNPKLNRNETDGLNPKQLQEYFDHFYKDIFLKLAEFGEIVSIVVCENENNHLNGNVYVKFNNDSSAYDSVMRLNQEWFAGRPVHCELSPVDNFADANCRAYDNSSCNRGDHCNFMHVRRPTNSLKNELFRAQEKSILLRKLQELTGTPELAEVTASSNDFASTTTDGPSQSEDNNGASSIASTTVTPSIVEKLFAI